MNTDRDVMEFSWEIGKKIWVYSQGNPAVMVASALVVAATAVGYGGYKYGRKYGTRLFDGLGWP